MRFMTKFLRHSRCAEQPWRRVVDLQTAPSVSACAFFLHALRPVGPVADGWRRALDGINSCRQLAALSPEGIPIFCPFPHWPCLAHVGNAMFARVASTMEGLATATCSSWREDMVALYSGQQLTRTLALHTRLLSGPLLNRLRCLQRALNRPRNNLAINLLNISSATNFIHSFALSAGGIAAGLAILQACPAILGP